MKFPDYTGQNLIAHRSDPAGEHGVQQIAIHLLALVVRERIPLLLEHKSAQWDVKEGAAQVRSRQ